MCECAQVAFLDGNAILGAAVVLLIRNTKEFIDKQVYKKMYPKMSSLFNHAFIPFVLLLVFSKKFDINPAKIASLVIFGILPDADIFFEHRALLHNFFVVLIPFLLFIFMKSRRETMAIICFYLASHIILDIFNGGVYIFYPLYEKLFFIQAEIAFQNNMILPKLDFGLS